jgi:D-tyrosyl-tRNA(Tyr) deacylase
MKLVIQRVREASVKVEEKLNGTIGAGFLILLGIEERDTLDDVEWLAQKVIGMRVFSDEMGKMNKDIREIGGEILVVSQFTLHASTKKGNRPSFIRAARPEQAIPLYEQFVNQLAARLENPIATGVFGADMQVALINNGPVTIIIDSQNRE